MKKNRNMKKIHLIGFLLLLFGSFPIACSKNTTNPTIPRVPDKPSGLESPSQKERKIRIIIGHQILNAVVYDNPTALSFLSQLPLSVEMNDFAQTEKIFYPPQGLKIENASRGMKPKIGDIGVYAPWGNIAVYYRDGGAFSNDMIPIGHILNGIDLFSVDGTLNSVHFEIVEIEKDIHSNP